MVRGRTTAPKGIVLGHEITGEIIEKARMWSFSTSGFGVCALQRGLRAMPSLPRTAIPAYA